MYGFKKIERYYMRYKLKDRKPENKETIIFKSKDGKLPEIGIWDEYETVSEIYVPANDDVEEVKNIEWWAKIPQ